LKEQCSYAYLSSDCLILYFKNATQHALPPDAAPLRSRRLNRVPLGCEPIVINRDAEERDDLLKDLAAVITSFCCRLYGLRRGQRKAQEIKDQLQCDAPSE